MARAAKKQITIFIEGCLAQGMMDAQACRAACEKFGIAMSTAYTYKDRAYEALTDVHASDTRRNLARMKLQIAAHIRRALGKKRRVYYGGEGKFEEVPDPDYDTVSKMIALDVKISIPNKNIIDLTPAAAAAVSGNNEIKSATSGQLRALIAKLSEEGE